MARIQYFETRPEQTEVTASFIYRNPSKFVSYIQRTFPDFDFPFIVLDLTTIPNMADGIKIPIFYLFQSEDICLPSEPFFSSDKRKISQNLIDLVKNFPFPFIVNASDNPKYYDSVLEHLISDDHTVETLEADLNSLRILSNPFVWYTLLSRTNPEAVSARE